MKLTVNLELDDLRKGEPHDATACPIALRLQKMGWEASVWSDVITIWKDKDILEYPQHEEDNDDCLCYDCLCEYPEMPGFICKNNKDVKDFIKQFDEGEYVEPCSFELDFKPEEIRLSEDFDSER